MRSLVVCLILLCSFVRATAIEAVVSHTLFYIADPAQPGKFIPSIEAYWQVNPRKLHYSTTPEKTIVANIKVDITLWNDAGIIKEDHYILQTTPRKSVGELVKNNVIDLRKYSITPGNVKMKFKLTDMADSSSVYTYADSFTVAPTEDSAFYSGLELYDTAFESTTASVFKKNGKMQIPACTNFLDDSKGMLHYYAELYQSDKIPAASYPLIQKVFIAKKEDVEAYGHFTNTDTIKGQKLSVASGSFNIRSLVSGNYYLRATVENKDHEVVASQVLFFQRLNDHPYVEKDTSKKKGAAVSDTGMEQVTLIDLNKTFVAKYTLGEVKAILKMMLPVADPLSIQNINAFLKKPDDMYMRYFIYNYFASINKDDPKQAWKDYSSKIIDVKRRFSEHGTPGYETDRGFIFLRYGPPTDVITVENESGTLPYEIWQYNTLTQTNRKAVANALFLFYRPQATFSYKLLHSTVDGEIQNGIWRSYLYVGSGGGTNGDSRAEQYIGNR